MSSHPIIRDVIINNSHLTAVLSLAILGWVFKYLVDINEKNKKKINAVESLLVNIKADVNILGLFVPAFKKETEKLLKEKGSHFFTPSDDSLDKTISIFKEHIILLPSELVSKIMVFNSYDTSLNELLQEMSRNDFAAFDESRKKKVVDYTIVIANELIPKGNELIKDIEYFLDSERNKHYKCCKLICCNLIEKIKCIKPQGKQDQGE